MCFIPVIRLGTSTHILLYYTYLCLSGSLTSSNPLISLSHVITAPITVISPFNTAFCALFPRCLYEGYGGDFKPPLIRPGGMIKAASEASRGLFKQVSQLARSEAFILTEERLT